MNARPNRGWRRLLGCALVIACLACSSGGGGGGSCPKTAPILLQSGAFTHAQSSIKSASAAGKTLGATTSQRIFINRTTQTVELTFVLNGKEHIEVFRIASSEMVRGGF